MTARAALQRRSRRCGAPAPKAMQMRVPMRVRHEEEWKDFCRKEREFHERRTLRHNAENFPYRVPANGDRVKVSGMRRHPQLNGACGKVVGGVDDQGFITVHLFNDGSDTTGSGDAMCNGQTSVAKKVRVSRLQPLLEGSISSPSLGTFRSTIGSNGCPWLGDPPEMDEWESVRTCSRTNNVASSSMTSRNGRCLGSAIGATARLLFAPSRDAPPSRHSVESAVPLQLKWLDQDKGLNQRYLPTRPL